MLHNFVLWLNHRELQIGLGLFPGPWGRTSRALTCTYGQQAVPVISYVDSLYASYYIVIIASKGGQENAAEK